MAVNYRAFLDKGKRKEAEFAKLLHSKLGGTIETADDETDIYSHIDLFWNGYGIDVKGLKKSRRLNKEPDESIHWIELKNVIGKAGWVFGKAKYIAFELEDYWMLITPKKIIRLLEQKVKDFNVITANAPLYRYYQRTGRADIIVKVKTIDLLVIANKILHK